MEAEELRITESNTFGGHQYGEAAKSFLQAFQRKQHPRFHFSVSFHGPNPFLHMLGEDSEEVDFDPNLTLK